MTWNEILTNFMISACPSYLLHLLLHTYVIVYLLLLLHDFAYLLTRAITT